MDDEAFLAAFEEHTWPRAQWHHREHLKVAYLYVTRHPFAEAVERMRAGVRAYNAAVGVVESPTGGYHDTMTVSWMHLMRHAVTAFGPATSADEFLDAQSQLLSKRALLFFYSRERIMSAAAKERFIEPDLTPFPRPGDGSAAP